MTKQFLILFSIIALLSIHAQDRNRGQDRNRNGGQGWQEQMKKFDKDGDGKLNDKERQQMRTEFQKQMEDRRKAFMKEHDKDGDGNLNNNERQAMIDRFRGEATKRAKEHFDRQLENPNTIKRYDKDGDGKLNDAEKKAATDEFNKRMEQGIQRAQQGWGGGNRDQQRGDNNNRGRGDWNRNRTEPNLETANQEEDDYFEGVL